MDADMLDGSVLALELRWKIVDVFTAHQLLPELIKDVAMNMKF